MCAASWKQIVLVPIKLFSVGERKRGKNWTSCLASLCRFSQTCPNSSATQPEFARSTALRAVEKELARCTTLIAQDEIEFKTITAN